jgi:hypothetical protein
VLALGYSRRAYAEGFEHERMEAPLAARVVSAEAEEK